MRPWLWNLAQRYRLTGWVSNDPQGVWLEVEGERGALDRFADAMQTEVPPLARLDAVEVTPIPLVGDLAFVIRPSSTHVGQRRTQVPPDVAPCADCLRELRDPSDRRYRYPFLNCTQCGPRFTLIESLPYDRPRTTMRHFAMCADCAAEYHNPQDRRFHAQPTACPRCGPQLELVANGHRLAEHDAALEAARQRLRAGQIVAIKGIGGFHLACDATQNEAVQRLRQRKRRGSKPFAVLLADVATARRWVEIDATAERLLTSRERPIVLLPRREPLADAVAPGQATLGVMLPYSPLHELLCEAMPPLVLTSGNLADEPIARSNEEALTALASLADAFLLHDREIRVRCEDSVVRCDGSWVQPIRRSRGYAPRMIRLPGPVRPTLAVGGDWKGTICLADGEEAWVSPHLGDWEHPQSVSAAEAMIDHLATLFSIEPQQVVCDRHPDYFSAQFAQRYAQQHGIALLRVQHHFAHALALQAEHRFPSDRPMLAVVFDGTGWGDDGTFWGGEWLGVQYGQYRRWGQLRPLLLPGGDAATRQIDRLALALLQRSGEAWSDDLPCVAATTPHERRLLAQLLHRGIGGAVSSSVGRWLDALASLIGIRQVVDFEAQAAMELEALADAHMPAEADFSATLGPNDTWIWDTTPIVRCLLAALRRGETRAQLAGRCQAELVRGTVAMCQRIREHWPFDDVGLSGGVFQNVWISQRLTQELTALGYRVWQHQQVPANDGGLSLGQAWATAYQHDSATR